MQQLKAQLFLILFLVLSTPLLMHISIQIIFTYSSVNDTHNLKKKITYTHTYVHIKLFHTNPEWQIRKHI